MALELYHRKERSAKEGGKLMYLDSGAHCLHVDRVGWGKKGPHLKGLKADLAV
jgi:hypothetical protein